VKKLVRLNDESLQTFLETDTNERMGLLNAAGRYQLVRHQRELARTQYREIAKNDGVEGLFIEAEPTAEGINGASKQISETLIESFRTLGGVRSGAVGIAELDRGSNAISQSFYAIVGAQADKFKDIAVVVGTAATRDPKGREVAQKKVLVARTELERLKSTLDAIHKKFQSKVAKADRQDVSQVLDELKQLTAQTAAGQDSFAADVQLKDAVTDLPLRTTVLETTPRDLAVMPSDAFKQWLNKLEAAIFRADDLLNGKADWSELSSLAANDKFTFLHLNELP
jgi:hypothetical protein